MSWSWFCLGYPTELRRSSADGCDEKDVNVRCRERVLAATSVCTIVGCEQLLVFPRPLGPGLHSISPLTINRSDMNTIHCNPT